jgi:glucan-binding YG repeat protein
MLNNIKKIIFIAICSVFLNFNAHAQDILKLETGETIKTKIIDITYFNVIYKLHEKQDSAAITLPKIKVSSVTFADGHIEKFNVKQPETKSETKQEDLYTRENKSGKSNGGTIINNEPVKLVNKEEDRQLEIKGKADAELYYTKDIGGAIGTGATSIVCSPCLGLIPAIAISSATIKDENLGYPDKQLMKNEGYKESYKKTAQKKKVTTTWIGFAAGTVLYVGGYIVLVLLGAFQ